MFWEVVFYPALALEFDDLGEDVRIELVAHAKLLEQFGPQLGRPHADTLNGSRHTNMKELRFYADNGVLRFACAFDPRRRAVVLIGGDKSSVSEEKFYHQLVEKADARFDDHLARLKKEKK